MVVNDTDDEESTKSKRDEYCNHKIFYLMPENLFQSTGFER